MEKRYLLTVNSFDEEKVQITIIDQKHCKVIYQSISVRQLVAELLQAFSVMYGAELKVSDKTMLIPRD